MVQQTNLRAVEGLEPTLVWQYFAGIASIPRPSKREGRVRDHVAAIAKSHGWKSHVDEVGNLVIGVPATSGRETAPIIVLQAHLDMVCEKNAASQHNFDDDGVQLVPTKDSDGARILRASGTTLGADNGIGVAMALAAATSPHVTHGPLELLLTIDEEDGMSGAKGLAAESIHGRRLLNLDSEEDDALYIGCAGGCDSNLRFSFDLQPVATNADLVRVTVTGLRGGHSGSDIHEGRGCANELLVRVMRRADRPDLRIARIDGGGKRNAISREASAVLVGEAGLRDALVKVADQVRAEAELESNEPGARIVVEPASEPAAAALSTTDTTRLVVALTVIPHGVLGMHPSVPGLVQTSNNFATMDTVVSSDGKSAEIVVGTMTRSSSDSRLQAVVAALAALGRLAGAESERRNEYPGWDPNPNSAVLGVCRSVYERLFGAAPRVEAIHAGLECGIIGRRVGGMDMVSFGPLIVAAHSPDERVYVDSVGKSWKYLAAVLDELSRG